MLHTGTLKPGLWARVKAMPHWRHWLIFGACLLAAFLFFTHTDVVETANHSVVLLDSLFKGRFMEFYNDVAAHPFGKGLYYLNNANYNVVVYLIFAVAELPVYLASLVFSAPLNETALTFVGKLVSAGFFVGCIPLVRRIGAELGFDAGKADLAALAFALAPPAFFSAAVMGQYDSICLFFTLLGVLFWLRGRLGRCAFWIGAGAACKLFPLFLLVPLVLLREKRPLRVLGYGAASLWLLAPTALLFAGRSGSSAGFGALMVERLLAVRWPFAVDMPVFFAVFAALCLAAWFWRPRDEALPRAGLWFCMATLGALFLLVQWHPQWVLLVVPFLVLTTFMEKARLPWLVVDLALAGGFFLYCFASFPGQLEGNMLDFGLANYAFGLHVNRLDPWPVVEYLSLLPAVSALGMPLFASALGAHIALKLPLARGTPASRLWGGAAEPFRLSDAGQAWLVFGGGMAMWLLPSLAALVQRL